MFPLAACRPKSGGPSAPSAPTGATGLWVMSDYAVSPRSVVPNRIAPTMPVSANLFAGSRRLFSNTAVWTSSGGTVTDDAATAPDSSSEASTAVMTGAWLIHPTDAATIPAGTYTMAVNAKRNTGTDQQFSFSKDNTSTRSSASTATSAWQRFTYTFTLGAGTTNNKLSICSIDGTTAANLQICDFELYAGSSDLGPDVKSGHFYPGGSAFDTKPSYSSGALDLSSGGYGFVQLASSNALSTWTVQGLVSKVGAGSGGYASILSKVQSYSSFTAFAEIGGIARPGISGIAGNKEAGYDNSGTAAGGLWSLLNTGYHLITVRYDGTNQELFLDDVRIGIIAGTVSSQTVRDFFVNATNVTSLYGGNKFVGMGLWPNALSNAQIAQSLAYWKSVAAASSITVNGDTTDRIYVAEGDSISGGFTYSYPYQAGPSMSPAILGANFAVSASVIADVTARQPYVNAIIPTNKNGRKFILSVLLGANDLGSTNPNFATNLAVLLDAYRAAGWLVVLGTTTPSTNATINTQRNVFNPILRTWVGVHCDAIADYAADPTMGPDAAASNTTYYADGLHPTAAGALILAGILATAVNGL